MKVPLNQMSNASSAINGSHLWLLAGVLIYAATFFVYYPSIFAIRDESGYLSMAYTLREGTVYAEKTGVPNNYFLTLGRHWVSISPLGNSLALVPFTLLGWKSVFLLGFLMHLLGVFYFYKFIEKEGLSPGWALLYLFFPAFVLYSRTIMSDIPALTLFLMGAYFYRRNRLGWAGIFWGASMTFRLTNVVGVVPFGIAALARSIRSKSFTPLFSLSFGIFICAILMAVQNFFCYGSPWTLGLSRDFNGVVAFSSHYFIRNLWHYFSSLSIQYPLMCLLFFSVTFFKKYAEFAWSAISIAGVYLFYYFYDTFSGPLPTLMFGNRYFFPVIAFLLVGYIGGCDKWLQKWPRKVQSGFWAVLLLGLAASNVVVQKKHFDFLEQQRVLKDLVYENTTPHSVIVHDVGATELLQKVWGDREYVTCREEELEKTLTNLDFSKEVFLVTRDIQTSAGLSLSNMNKAFDGLTLKWHKTPVAISYGLHIDRIEK